MSDIKDIMTTKLLSKEIVEKNKSALDIIDIYSKANDIIVKTYMAIGKKTTFRVTSSSTINEKLKTNVFASTH